MATEQDVPAERLQVETALLKAIYPEGVSFDAKAREIKYLHASPSSQHGATLVLRLPDQYPAFGVPMVISASSLAGEDLRTPTVAAVEALRLIEGDEILDAFILAFRELVEAEQVPPPAQAEETEKMCEPPRRTVVIWLHHLLSINKRKLATHPRRGGDTISGATKPGYPGLMVFSGPKADVDEHVAELRAQRWKAFQIRYDSSDIQVDKEEWQIEHGGHIREVETMGEAAASINGEFKRETFLKALGLT